MQQLDNIAHSVIDLIAREWEAQGHNLSGKFMDSGMEYTVEQQGNDYTIRVFDVTGRGYGKILDEGVQASQIKYPYARARILGLTLYGMARLGLPEEEAVRFAFAVATKHKREGMPLPDTVRFSRTGKRTAFVADATVGIQEVVRRELGQFIKQAVQEAVMT